MTDLEKANKAFDDSMAELQAVIDAGRKQNEEMEAKFAEQNAMMDETIKNLKELTVYAELGFFN